MEAVANRNNTENSTDQGYEIYSEDPAVKNLIEKHRAEINRIIDKVAVGERDYAQQKEEFVKLGIDPQELMSYYKETLIQPAEELRKHNKVASKWVQIINIASGVVGTVIPFLFDKKHFNNRAMQAMVAIFVGSAAGVLGNFVSGKLLLSGIRKQSEEELSIKARDVFERELAIALENKELSDAKAKEIAVDTEKPDYKEQNGQKYNVSPRDASHAAEARKPKAPELSLA